jgi:hypothetical protein
MRIKGQGLCIGTKSKQRFLGVCIFTGEHNEVPSGTKKIGPKFEIFDPPVFWHLLYRKGKKEDEESISSKA